MEMGYRLYRKARQVTLDQNMDNPFHSNARMQPGLQVWTPSMAAHGCAYESLAMMAVPAEGAVDGVQDPFAVPLADAAPEPAASRQTTFERRP